MSFKSNILIFISLMLVVLLVGTFGLNMSTTQAFLEKQLQSHSYDTANSLGLSLSAVADNPSSAQTMIDAVFDRGHFARIELLDIDGQPVYQRSNDAISSDIPHWFIELVDINIAPSSAVVQRGWMPIGKLKVQAHKGYAYIELWLVFKSLVQWFLIAAAIFLTSAYIAVRLLLRPLKRAQKQAHAIANKEYILQDPLPKTTEFRQLVNAMNGMVTKLQQVFTREAQVAEKLRSMAYQDSVTGLYNRHYFDMTFSSIVDEDQTTAQGTVYLLRINGLKEFNTHYGYQLGNELVKHLARIFRTTLSTTDGVYVRLNGIELIALLPNTKPSSIQKNADQLLLATKTLREELNLEEMPIELTAAIARYTPNESKSKMFSQLDFLIQQAGEVYNDSVQVQREDAQRAFNNDQWQQLIDTAIVERRFKLFKQDAFNLEKATYESELLVRMIGDDGKIQSAAYFMPAVEQLRMESKIDQLVLRLVTEHLQSEQSSTVYSINLSKSLLLSSNAFDQLVPHLEQARGAKLAFEFPESAVYNNLAACKNIFNVLRQFGFKVGIDRFGIQVADLQYLKTLQPDYIKLDASFSDQIESDASTNSYVESICEVASNLDIDVFAMSIEQEAQLEAFKSSGVRYFQGYYFSTPIPL
ncbi:bifunctional diguanylate cyclase/phosphodiesterase [Marinomonas gallaica]|uniref:bifunctional diguanylate cyclase/phosphodiesterase n=1 Tax=Marinomonas gallaica TaxID=1806667 RepID=UPI000833C5E4|nr:EAL domain-containing protein [Marinomonas gallaica]